MASYTSAWLVGSVKDLGYYYSIGAALKQVTGDRYLYHPTANLSILNKIQADLVAEGFGAATAVLTRDRRVKLASGAGNFTITWDSTALRDLLGFTATLTGAATYTATNISPLLWSPGKPLMPELSPVGTTGNRRPLAYWTQSPTDGSPFVVAHGERIDQRWSVSHVSQGRMQTSSEAGGEWAVFFEQCVEKGYSWYVYPSVTEETGSSTAATLSNGLGPYVLAVSGRAPSWDFQRARGFEFLDGATKGRNVLQFGGRIVPEYA